MQYIIIPASETQTSEERTRALSRQLFRLSRPIPNPDDVTEYLFGFVTHPVTKEVAMECDTETVIPVSPDADATALAVLLEPTPEQQTEIEALAQLVESRKGSTLSFGEIVPSWVTLRTRQEMDADGWFPKPPAMGQPE